MGGIYAPIDSEEHWFVGETRTLRFPIVERTPDANSPTGYTEAVPSGIQLWQCHWVLKEDSAVVANILLKGPISPDVGGILLVAIDDSDYPPTMPPGTYYHTLFRTDGDVWRHLSFGPAVLHPRLAVTV